jgi:polyhydroxyalkanoate synthesis regulator phasin
MKLGNKWTVGLLSLGAAAIVGVSTTLYSNVYAQSATADQAPSIIRPERLGDREDHSALLAEVLGISQEELQAAVKIARDAAIDQAVADGKITQEQASQMKADEDRRGMGWGPLASGADHDAELAKALGITVEALQAGKTEVQQRILNEAVAAGEITQEEADLMQARQALNDYLRDKMQSAYEAAVAQAVSDGVITQAQADQIVSENGPGFFGHGMGHGMMGEPQGGPGHGHGRGDRQAPNISPLQPNNGTQDNGTQEDSSGTALPSSNLSL